MKTENESKKNEQKEQSDKSFSLKAAIVMSLVAAIIQYAKWGGSKIGPIVGLFVLTTLVLYLVLNKISD